MSLLDQFKQDLNDIIDEDVKKNSTPKLLFDVELNMSRSCNCKCTYCFERKRSPFENYNMTLMACDIIVDRVKMFMNTKYYKEKFSGVRFTFWGGEPTLNPAGIMKVLYETVDDKDISYHIYTNGTNKEILNDMLMFLKHNKALDRISIQLSYDGKIHNDQHRLFALDSTVDTGALVLDSFNMIKTLYPEVKLTMKSTLTQDSFYMGEELWKEFAELSKDSSVQWSPTIDYTSFKTNSEKYLSEFELMLKKIIPLELEYYRKYHKFNLIWFEYGSLKVCGKTPYMMAVDVDGYVFSCHGCLYGDRNKRKLFNIFSNNIIEYYNYNLDKEIENSYYIPDECSTCSATACMVCGAECEMATGDWYKRNYNHTICDYFKLFGIYDKALKVYLLEEETENILKEVNNGVSR